MTKKLLNSNLIPEGVQNAANLYQTEKMTKSDLSDLINTCINSEIKPVNILFGILLLISISGLESGLFAQDPLRFQTEVDSLKLKNTDLGKGTEQVMLFTGSSSIRMWKDLQDRFPEQKILNLGFGGSQATDLLYFLQPLVLDYRPQKVFIYEGDNDLAEGKNVGEVLRTLREIATRLEQSSPGTPLVFISVKPSISRWNLRRKYRRLNRKIERWTRREPTLNFVDVWNPMLTDKSLNKALFIEDGLHMNDSGYDIWEAVLTPYITTDNPVSQ